MSRYPLLVEVAWNVVNKFLHDWQKSPFLFYRERDVQAELYSRLNTAYYLLGLNIVESRSEARSKMKSRREFNRVVCEPKISYSWEKENDAWCYPDIVVWSDLKNPELPPEDESNQHMAWACEIKYVAYSDIMTRQLMEYAKKEVSSQDIEKLRLLVDQDKLQYACALFMSLGKSADDSESIVWERSEKEGRVWVCAAQIPKAQFPA